MEMDSMVRPMKWHIYHDEQNGEAFPLCWDGMAIEFNSEDEARKFAEDHPEIGTDWFVKEDILYYDGGYITGFAARQLEAFEKGEY